MDSKLPPLERAEMRIKVLSRQLQEAKQRNLDYCDDIDSLQTRISGLLAQLNAPQSLDEVIHPRT